MRIARRHLWVTALILTLGLFCTIRDDNGNLALSGPTGPDVIPEENTTDAVPSLFASPESAYVRLGDTLAIRIHLLADTSTTNSLIPLTGIKVTASVSKGKIIDDTLTTDANGRVSFLFTDTIAGKVDFTVKSGTAQQTARFEVTNTPDKVQKLIEALPEKSLIKADGQDFTYIEVRLLNDFHNPISGECVQFITTSGIIIGEGSQCSNAGQSKTGSDGIARAKLISSNINDTAYVTTYLASDQSLSDETEVAFMGMTISVLTDESKLSTGDTAVISAKVINASGNAVSKAPIFFSLKNGTSSNLKILSSDVTTNYDGMATARVKALKEGFDVVTINSCGTQASVQINVSSLSLVLSVDKTILQTRETDSATLISTFKNSTGTPLSGKTIKLTRYYKTESGQDTSDMISGISNSSGKCSFVITALPYEGTMRLEAIGFDKTDGYASADTSIQFITTRVMTIRATEFIAADGSSKAPVTAFVKNKSGNPIVGDVISFSTTAGMITEKVETDMDGKATAYLTSDRRNITATITATLASDPSKQQSAQVEFTGVEITTNAEPPSISSDGKDTSRIFISLFDAAQNPIAGEPVNFSKQLDATVITASDSVTNNRGEATCKIYGTASGMDTIRISAAGATGSVILNYSSNIVLIDTAAGQACVADSSDSTLINVTYLQGNKTTPIPGATVEICATIGKFDTLFAKSFTTNSSGKFSFYLHNPHFASTAVIYALARTSSEITTASFPLYFRANNVKRITLSGTPEVININGSRSKITAIAFDSLGNRVKDARLSFNIVNGPSGGEYLDPPVSITGDDGSAFTYIVSGKTPSFYKQVWVVAGNFSSVKSDTVKFTFAGPPKYITIRTNVLKGENPNDGTFSLPCAAIVTDVNGNPVADGTEVNFSLQVSGFIVKKSKVTWTEQASGSLMACNYTIDTSSLILPFEDFNDNFHLDPGEDLNGDGKLNRGEDINGDGIYIRGPQFEDINGDGIRQYNPELPVEELRDCTGSTKFADLNGNGRWDPIEPLSNATYRAIYDSLVADSAYWKSTVSSVDSIRFAKLAHLDSLYEATPGFIPELRCFDIDVDHNGVADPNTAVSINRTVGTSGGKALNKITYGQSDANRVEVMIWAESQGVVTETPEKIVLPVVTDE